MKSITLLSLRSFNDGRPSQSLCLCFQMQTSSCLAVVVTMEILQSNISFLFLWQVSGVRVQRENKNDIELLDITG